MSASMACTVPDEAASAISMIEKHNVRNEVPRMRETSTLALRNQLQLIISVPEISSLVNDFSLNVYCQIFEYLGFAGGRLLGASCISFYKTYKEHLFEDQIKVNFSETFGPHLIPSPWTIGPVQYIEVVVSWLARPRAASASDRLSALRVWIKNFSHDFRRNHNLAPYIPANAPPSMVLKFEGRGMMVLDWDWAPNIHFTGVILMDVFVYLVEDTIDMTEVW